MLEEKLLVELDESIDSINYIDYLIENNIETKNYNNYILVEDKRFTYPYYTGNHLRYHNVINYSELANITHDILHIDISGDIIYWNFEKESIINYKTGRWFRPDIDRLYNKLISSNNSYRSLIDYIRSYFSKKDQPKIYEVCCFMKGICEVICKRHIGYMNYKCGYLEPILSDVSYYLFRNGLICSDPGITRMPS